jgi:hypothetical protein
MITHQALIESTLFDGWHEAFFCQWNAVMTLVGYVMLFPSSTISNQAKQAIELAISVFDNFGAKFPVAANAAKIVRDLIVKIEVLAKLSDLASNAAIIPQDFEASSSSSVSIDQSLPSHDSFDAPDFNLFDMAVDIDFWNSVEALWPEFDNISQF